MTRSAPRTVAPERVVSRAPRHSVQRLVERSRFAECCSCGRDERVHSRHHGRPMTTLRAKYIRDLAIRGRAARTQQSYTSYVADLARHYRRSPDQISYEEVADWLHHLIKERHQSASSVNIAVNAVRFLYGVTLGRDVEALLASVPRMKRVPVRGVSWNGES